MLINENLQTMRDQIHEMLPRFSDQFILDILNELVTLGAVPDEDDLWLILFSIQSVEQRILNLTNQIAVPDGLIPTAVNMVCGNFVKSKYLSGALVMDHLRFEEAVQTVAQGDTTVTFAAGDSDEVKIAKLIDWLTAEKEGDFLCYRRMKW